MSESNQTRLKNVRGVGSTRFSHVMSTLSQANEPLDMLFNMSAEEIKKKFNLPKNVAEAVASAFKITPEQAEAEKLASRGIKTLRRGSENYPQHLEQILGDKAPAVLYAWGNMDLLKKPSVGFCGSRSATDKGIAITEDTARQIAELGWVVVSGHARGVDSKAHEMALAYGIGTIIVAPEGILDFKLRKELKLIAKSEQVLIISEFPPNAKWNVGYAMTRNKTIIGLSDAMILIEARNEGGTFEAGKEALRLKVPLYVAQYLTTEESSAGNLYFLKRGAKPLRKNKDTERANIESLKEEVAKMTKDIGDDMLISVERPQQIMLL
ncbi:MAG TPA: DNA-processing protein DprA [Phototrophicaceae bacterium]|nr:DNA-processing protein DprA [Phototrophicaceae bacterium]